MIVFSTSPVVWIAAALALLIVAHHRIAKPTTIGPARMALVGSSHVYCAIVAAGALLWALGNVILRIFPHA